MRLRPSSTSAAFVWATPWRPCCKRMAGRLTRLARGPPARWRRAFLASRSLWIRWRLGAASLTPWQRSRTALVRLTLRRSAFTVQSPNRLRARESALTETLRGSRLREGGSCARTRPLWHATSLDALSPLKVLGRGYALARDAEGHILSNASQVEVGDSISVLLGEGELGATVTSTGKAAS